jgi:hypothetical protein
MILFLSLLFPIIGFLLQTYTRLFNKNFGVDVWTRLLETDHVRKAGHKMPGNIGGQFIVEGHFDYPPVFPFLLSFFNRRTIEKYQGLVAPFFDSLNNLLVFWVAYYFTNNIFLSILAQAIYTFTPVMVLENSSLTPRSLGYLMFNLSFLSLLMTVLSSNYIFLILAFIFSTLLFLSHRFAMQSLFFISIFFTFWQHTPIYLGVFSLSLILAILVTKGYYLKVLIGHLYNIYFWIPNRDFRFAHQIRGPEKWTGKKDFVELVYFMLSKFAPLSMIATNPWIIGAILVFAVSYFPNFFPLGIAIPVYIFIFTIWVVVFYIIGIPILMLPQLRCIGEGYRYLEMAALPASVIASWLFFQIQATPYSLVANLFYFGIFIGNLGLIIYAHKKIISDRNRSVTVDMQNAFNFLNKHPKVFRVLCIPHQNTTNLIYHTKHQVFVNANNAGLIPISVVYPIIKWPLTDTIEKYDLNLIFLKESFAKIKELKLKKYKEIFRSGDIVILTV